MTNCISRFSSFVERKALVHIIIEIKFHAREREEEREGRERENESEPLQTDCTSLISLRFRSSFF